MLAFAGLSQAIFNPASLNPLAHMVKYVSYRLHGAILNCYPPIVLNEPVFAEFYAKKRTEGKTHQVAMAHVAQKLLRVIDTLQTKNVPYDPTLVRWIYFTFLRRTCFAIISQLFLL